ncbi:hypothetical protein ANN_06018 [Periplaneta americana]|uniref:Uncharacterized protein n=1 Tax=Periplaneta americana TaxID=6978 RepID=A0ABQ8TEJ9_PERAM|nr:hypothetical protein ANN_06018 [Periplaneta americana]
MEYGAEGWDPYRQNQIDSIEKVQRRAEKYVKMGKEHGEEIVKDLGWEFFKLRRRKTTLTSLFKAQMGHKAWTDINARLVTPSYLDRADHVRKFKCRKQRTDVAKFFFVNRTIVDWNSLPAAIFQVSSLVLSWQFFVLEHVANDDRRKQTVALDLENLSSGAVISVHYGAGTVCSLAEFYPSDINCAAGVGDKESGDGSGVRSLVQPF